MEKDFLSIVFFGEGSQRFKLISSSYLFLMIGLITNHIMNSMGYYFTPQKIELHEIISFFLSKQAILVTSIFLILCMVFIWFFRNISFVFGYFLGGFFTYIEMMIGVLLVDIQFMFFTKKPKEWKFKKFFITRLAHQEQKERTLINVLMEAMRLYKEVDNVKYRGGKFHKLKLFIQDLNDEQYFLNHVSPIAAIFITSSIVFYIYNMSEMISIYFIGTFYFLTAYVFVSYLKAFFYFRHREKLMDLLLEIRNEAPPAGREREYILPVQEVGNEMTEVPNTTEPYQPNSVFRNSVQ